MSNRFAFLPSRRAGFTLMEIAIVLSVIGVILAAVWTAAGVVNEKSRVANAVNEYNLVTQGMTSLLQAGYGVANAPANGTDITSAMITSGAVPQGYVDSSGTTASDPWKLAGLALIWKTASPRKYEIDFSGTSHSGCTSLIMQTTNCKAGQPGCPVYVVTASRTSPNQVFDTTSGTITTTQAESLCDQNNYTGGVDMVGFYLQQ